MNLTLSTPAVHIPVLLEEAIAALNVRQGKRYIDCTVGTGGHASAILENCMPGGQLIGIDADPASLSLSEEKLLNFGRSAILVNANFSNLQAICLYYNFYQIDGILFDLGMSSLQLSSSSRGFSFQHNGPLDMRFSPTLKLTASDIVNTFPEDKLGYLIEQYGEERYAMKLARHLVQNRPITGTAHLARLIEQAIGRRGKIHPATRTFQALRIAVNQELERLDTALRQAVNLLAPGGRLVVISYHSLDDRLVKEFLKQESKDCICPPEIPACTCDHTPTLMILTKKVITPSTDEIRENPRSRSARMRVSEHV